MAAQPVVRAQGQAAGSNQLALWSDTPRWVRSTAPLADERGLALPPPIAGPAGHALYLTDKQVRRPFESFRALGGHATNSVGLQIEVVGRISAFFGVLPTSRCAAFLWLRVVCIGTKCTGKFLQSTAGPSLDHTDEEANQC